MESKRELRSFIFDVLYAVIAGVIVGTAYHFFQNSNGFAPGGVGGLATITHYILADKISWSLLMIAFNLPIFILLSAFVNKKLGAILSLYMIVQSFTPRLYDMIGAAPYSLANNQEDFNIVFACVATGVISGFSAFTVDTEPAMVPFLRVPYATTTTSSRVSASSSSSTL